MNNNSVHRNHKQVNYKLLLFHFRESKYYPFFFHGSIILLCVLLIVFVLIPLGSNLFSTNKAVAEERQRIALLQQNITYLSSLSDSTAEQNILLANALVPKSKDFNDAIQALNAAAVSASVTIQSFTFNVGAVKGNRASTGSTSEMDMQVLLQGSTANFVSFLQALDSKVPLMNVETFAISKDTATVQIQVAYKPYTETKVDLSSTLIAPSASTLAVLQKAEEWKSQSVVNVAASSSATPQGNLPPF